MRDVLESMSRGIYLLTTRYDEKDNGCIVSSAMRTGTDQIAVCVKKHNTTSCIINRTKIFNLCILSQDTSFDIIRNFGFQSGKDVDKFENFRAFKRSKNGLAYLTKAANAYVSVEVDKVIDLGEAALFVGKIVEMEELNEVKSLSYDYFMQNIQPKDEVRYKCRICGHEYVGEIPDDYVCPICGNTKEVFQKL